MCLPAIIDFHIRYLLNLDISSTMSADWRTKVLNQTNEKYSTSSILAEKPKKACLVEFFV